MIQLDNIAKRYEHTWIFKEINLTIEDRSSYALIGNNGSGKSTLLRCIAQMHQLNKGTIHYTINNKKIEPEKFYKHYSYCAPGMEIIEDLTLVEFLNFHFQFKERLPEYSIDDIINTINLNTHKNTSLRYFSSGMKQRVKLAQALFSDVPYVFLDEPCTNFDQQGFDLYHQLIQMTAHKKTVIIASNDHREFNFVQHQIDLHQYKK